MTSCADSGPGTLRQAMLDARNDTTVEFSQLGCTLLPPDVYAAAIAIHRARGPIR